MLEPSCAERTCQNFPAFVANRDFVSVCLSHHSSDSVRSSSYLYLYHPLPEPGNSCNSHPALRDDVLSPRNLPNTSRTPHHKVQEQSNMDTYASGKGPVTKALLLRFAHFSRHFRWICIAPPHCKGKARFCQYDRLQDFNCHLKA